MKKIFLIIVFTSWTALTFAQDYYPLIEENKKWSTLNVIYLSGEPMFDTTYTTWSHFISGDSIYNNIEYKKLFASNEENPDNWILWGFIREDSTKKVWLRRIPDDEEVLLYDFTLAEGDSIKLGYDTFLYYYVDSITTELLNDAPRKKYWISYEGYDWQDTWIEGIGSNRGILASGSAGVVGGWFWALCMWEADELIYISPNFDACYLITDIREYNNRLFQIYPNPIANGSANKTINISVSENVLVTWVGVYEVSGQLVLERSYQSPQPPSPRGSSFSLNIGNLNPGTYLIEVETKDGQREVKRLVIAD